MTEAEWWIDESPSGSSSTKPGRIAWVSAVLLGLPLTLVAFFYLLRYAAIELK
jgi:hypothetical protein